MRAGRGLVALLDIPAEMFVVRLRVALTHTDLTAVTARQRSLRSPPGRCRAARAPGRGRSYSLAGLREDGVADPPVLVTSGRQLGGSSVLVSITVKHGRHFPLLH